MKTFCSLSKWFPLSICLLPFNSYATNGMSLEGYGPISTAMGGTAQAYDIGIGAMMNNPATLGLNDSEGSKLQVMLGVLKPEVQSTNDIGSTDAGGLFIMPGFGYYIKSHGFTRGIGIIPQGGMGTDYGKAKPGDVFYKAKNTLGQYKEMSGKSVRSELGVGRLVLPLNMEVNKKLTIGGSFDIVWGGLDIQMDMGGQDFADVIKKKTGSAHVNLPTNLNNSLVNAAQLATISGYKEVINSGADVVLSRVNYARFDFSDDSDFTQATLGAGFAGKLGFLYQSSKTFSFGASYHSVTKMSDFTGNAAMSLGMDLTGDLSQLPQSIQNLASVIGASDHTSIDLKGEIKVRNFQWPETYAVGAKWRPFNFITLTADMKKINWAAVMKNFQLTFIPDITQGAVDIDITLDQNWKDQTVYMYGGEIKLGPNLALRAGYNYASNPVPDSTLNPLFPAIVTTHYTGGFGWQMSKEEVIDFSMVIVPEAKNTGATGTTTTHSQMNFQLQYSLVM